jgi:hypothetical protein
MLDAAWRREEKGIRMIGLRPVCHRFCLSPLLSVTAFVTAFVRALKMANLPIIPFCGNLSLSLSDTTEGHLRRAIYHLVYSIADAKVHTILLNRVDCG